MVMVYTVIQRSAGFEWGITGGCLAQYAIGGWLGGAVPGKC
ncbi:MAG: hypothetical protein ACLUNY_13890 [Enterococcus avium]